jgi:hypothetical protein
MEPEVKPDADALPTLQDLPASEYRQVREGKSIADVVKARPEPEPVEVETPAAEAPARDDAGRFATKQEAEAAAIAEAKKGKPKYDPEARKAQIRNEINELLHEKGQSKAERDAIAAELATLRAERDALKAPTKAQEPAPAAPQAEKFPDYDSWLATHADASYEDYTDARIEFKVEQRDKARQAEQAEKAEQAKQAEVWKPFQEREAAFKAKTPDYDTVIQRSPVAAMPLPPWVIEEVASNDQGPALRYHLAQHPDETQWIASLPKAAAIRHLRSILSETAAPTVTTAQAPQTKADPPFETVGVSQSAASTSLDTVASRGSAADYRRIRERMRS